MTSHKSAVVKLIILDRDGTIIDFVRDAETGVVTTAFHPSQLRLLDGVKAGLLRLSSAGYTLAIATNQPGPAKGHFAPEAVTRTNDALVAKLAVLGIEIARVEVCMHHPDGGEGGVANLAGACNCRKPKPGMLFSAMAALGATPEGTWMVGDATGDVQAGHAAGVKTALLLPARCELCPHKGETPRKDLAPDVTATELDALACAIMAKDGSQ